MPAIYRANAEVNRDHLGMGTGGGVVFIFVSVVDEVV